MNPWQCATLIFLAGAVGGVVNALVTDNGFTLPQSRGGIWCVGFISNVIIGAVAAFSSWAFYGSGAGIEVAAKATELAAKTTEHAGISPERAGISLTFTALAGALLVGVAGARWITNEIDKRLLKESVKIAGSKELTPEQCQKVVEGSAIQVLENVKNA
jgi:hypothetical protein